MGILMNFGRKTNVTIELSFEDVLLLPAWDSSTEHLYIRANVICQKVQLRSRLAADGLSYLSGI